MDKLLGAVPSPSENSDHLISAFLCMPVYVPVVPSFLCCPKSVFCESFVRRLLLMLHDIVIGFVCSWHFKYITSHLYLQGWDSMKPFLTHPKGYGEQA